MIACPACDAEIDVEEDDLDEGDTLTCDECGADVRVVSIDPLELESVEDEDEEGPALDEDEDEDEEFPK